MKIRISEIVTAFNDNTVGTKVINEVGFMAVLRNRVAEFVFPENGQGFVPMSDNALPFVTSGVARRADCTTDDYIVREHRGEVCMFAKRERACPVESLACIVYTAHAYLADPEVSQAERVLIMAGGYTHVLVAVLASAGPRPPLSSHRFVRNLAGGNAKYQSDDYTIETAREEAATIANYERDYITVAD